MKIFKRFVAWVATVVVSLCGCLSLAGCSIDDLENIFGGLQYELGGLTGKTDLEKQDEAVVEVMIKAASNIRDNLLFLGQDAEEAVKSLSVSTARVKYWSGSNGGVVYCKLTYKYSGMTEVSYCKANISNYNEISSFKTINASVWSEETMTAGEGYKWATINVQNINAAYDYYLENGSY